ncbi:MAG: hypothetical protein ACNS63_11715 [Candidatus Nitrospinota bacterium M3_3B_026]
MSIEIEKTLRQLPGFKQEREVVMETLIFIVAAIVFAAWLAYFVTSVPAPGAREKLIEAAPAEAPEWRKAA